MFADPLTVVTDHTTITNDTTASYAAIERAADHSLYRSAGSDFSESWDLFVGHQFGRRNRYTARLTVSGLYPDLLIDGNNSRFSQSCYVVFDSPNIGPVNPYASGITMPNAMIKAIGGLLVSVDTASPVFARVLAGET